MDKLRQLLLIASCLSLGACASVASGRHETLSVTSSPSGADARLVCERVSVTGVTPAKLTIRRNAGDCSLTVAKPGFAAQTFTIEQGVNPMYWGNMIFAPVGPAGGYVVAAGDSGEKAAGVGLLAAAVAIFGTDFVTGAVHVHRPNSVDVVLKPDP
jgi:hypothetical protein